MPENKPNNILDQYLALAQKLREHCSTLTAATTDTCFKEYIFPTFNIAISEESVSMSNQKGNITFTITDTPSEPAYSIITFSSNSNIRYPILGCYNKNNHFIQGQRKKISNPDIDIITFIKQELAESTPKNVRSYSSYVSELQQALDFFRDIFEFGKAQTPAEYLQKQQQKQEKYHQIHFILQQFLTKIDNTKLSDLLHPRSPEIFDDDDDIEK